jgi:small nuclear ribonucleoprotein (snRNP)-like protein
MASDILEVLKANTDKTVKITCKDGEVLIAKVLCVFDEEGEMVYDLVSSSDKSKYEKNEKKSAYLLRLEDVGSAEPIAT